MRKKINYSKKIIKSINSCDKKLSKINNSSPLFSAQYSVGTGINSVRSELAAVLEFVMDNESFFEHEDLYSSLDNFIFRSCNYKKEIADMIISYLDLIKSRISDDVQIMQNSIEGFFSYVNAYLIGLGRYKN